VKAGTVLCARSIQPFERGRPVCGGRGPYGNAHLLSGLALNPDGRTRALGHVDLWDGSSYTHQAEDPRDYFTLESKIGLWKTRT